jgi:hypothetical protein
MSRSQAGRLAFGFFVLSAIFSGLIAHFEPDTFYNTSVGAPSPANVIYFQAQNAGKVIGGTFALFLFAAIIPMIIWAFCRFQLVETRLPFTLWGVLIIFVALISWMGTRQRHAEVIEQYHRNFVQGGLKTCGQELRTKRDPTLGAASDSQIDSYCLCYMEKAFNGMTPEEHVYLKSNRTLSDSIKTKLLEAGQSCAVAFSPS